MSFRQAVQEIRTKVSSEEMDSASERSKAVEPLGPEGAEIAAVVGVDVAVLDYDGSAPIPSRHVSDGREPGTASDICGQGRPVFCVFGLVDPAVSVRVYPLHRGAWV